MKKLKIGVLTEIINYHSGARAPLMIAKHLAKRGHNVTVFAYNTMLDHTALADLNDSGVRIVFIKIKRIKYFSAIALYLELKKNPPDAVWFSGTLPFFVAAKFTGVPIIRMYQGTQFDALLENKNPNEKLTFKDKFLNQVANLYIYMNDFISFRLSNSIVAISEFSAREGEALYKRKCDKVIFHGTSFLPIIKSPTKTKKNTFNIISVSRITPYKGFHILLNALKKIKTNKNILLTIVGSQPKLKYVKYLKKLGGKQVNIILNPSDNELSKLYKQTDICATADRYLYFGLSIYEAAYFNKPTIALNQAAALEIILHEKTGFVAENIDKLSHYMTVLINNPKLRYILGKNANNLAHIYTWDYCAGEWEKVILKTIKTK